MSLARRRSKTCSFFPETHYYRRPETLVVQVMGVNGVSHHVVTDDLEGASAVLQWLSTMPPIIGAPPPQLPSSDPIERSITYAPSGSKPSLSSSLYTRSRLLAM